MKPNASYCCVRVSNEEIDDERKAYIDDVRDGVFGTWERLG